MEADIQVAYITAGATIVAAVIGEGLVRRCSWFIEKR